jgi:hypothetical protein
MVTRTGLQKNWRPISRTVLRQFCIAWTAHHNKEKGLLGPCRNILFGPSTSGSLAQKLRGPTAVGTQGRPRWQQPGPARRWGQSTQCRGLRPNPVRHQFFGGGGKKAEGAKFRVPKRSGTLARPGEGIFRGPEQPLRTGSGSVSTLVRWLGGAPIRLKVPALPCLRGGRRKCGDLRQRPALVLHGCELEVHSV